MRIRQGIDPRDAVGAFGQTLIVRGESRTGKGVSANGVHFAAGGVHAVGPYERTVPDEFLTRLLW